MSQKDLFFIRKSQIIQKELINNINNRMAYHRFNDFNPNMNIEMMLGSGKKRGRVREGGDGGEQSKRQSK